MENPTLLNDKLKKLTLLNDKLKKLKEEFHELDYQNDQKKDKLDDLEIQLEEARADGESDEFLFSLEEKIKQAEIDFLWSVTAVEAKYYEIDDMKLKILTQEDSI